MQSANGEIVEYEDGAGDSCECGRWLVGGAVGGGTVGGGAVVRKRGCGLKSSRVRLRVVEGSIVARLSVGIERASCCHAQALAFDGVIPLSAGPVVNAQHLVVQDPSSATGLIVLEHRDWRDWHLVWELDGYRGRRRVVVVRSQARWW